MTIGHMKLCSSWHERPKGKQVSKYDHTAFLYLVPMKKNLMYVCIQITLDTLLLERTNQNIKICNINSMQTVGTILDIYFHITFHFISLRPIFHFLCFFFLFFYWTLIIKRNSIQALWIYEENDANYSSI